MKKFLIIFFAVIALVAVAIVVQKKDEGTTITENNSEKTLTFTEINDQLQNGEAVLLDVRSQIEYDMLHATPAQLFNVEWLKDGRQPDIEKDKTIYVYCRSGNRSAEARKILEEKGYEKVIDLGAFENWQTAGGSTTRSQLPPPEELLKQLGAQPIEVLGSEQAGLTMIKYHDFECPFCVRYTLETEQKIIDKYVSTGLMRYEFRNVSILGDESALAAVGGYCANEQKAFWTYHNEALKLYSQLGADFYSIESLANMMQDLGFDGELFTTCMDSGKYEAVVSSESIEADKAGRSGTPFFEIGATTINGAYPYEAFEAAIDSQL